VGFEINPKKSGVMVFGKRYRPTTLTVTAGDLKIPLVNYYKYLGIELTRTLRWKLYTDRILSKQKHAEKLGNGNFGWIFECENVGSNLEKCGKINIRVWM